MPINILLVDDSKSMRSVIKKVLQISGFDLGDLYEAGNGQEALEILQDSWVDLILTDVHMPEMGGIDFLKALKADEVLKKVPVVLITTEGREEKVQEAFSLGAIGYLKKPFTPEQIKETLRKVVGEEYAAPPEEDFDGCDF